VARAYCYLLRPEHAIHLADESRRYFERGPARPLCEALEVSGLAETQLERPEGLRAVEKALNVARGLDPLPKDLESRLLGRIVSGSAEMGAL
jgi:hypothetical protein